MSSNNNNYSPSIYHFIKPFVGLSVLIILGTICYMNLEGWNLLDSAFMSVETLTTVGFGLEKPLSVNGKIFTIFYIVFGVTLFLYLAAEFAEYIFMANYDERFKRKNMENKLKKMKNHYIVCGFGRTGREIASQLKDGKMDFVVLDTDERIQAELQELGYLYLTGDATDDTILEKAGIEKAKGLFCALSDDVDNLYLTVSAKNINTDLKIISRCVKATNETKFKKAGATTVILPYEISARRMVSSVVKPMVVDFLDVVMHTSGDELELKLEQFRLTKGSEFEGKTILSSKIKELTGVIVVAIKRNNEFLTNPKPDMILEINDYLIALGTNQELNNLKKMF